MARDRFHGELLDCQTSVLERPWSRLSHWWFVPTQWSSCIPANLCPGESGRAVSFHLRADDEFNLKQKSNGGFKLATSPLDTCFADLGIDYLCHPDNALSRVPAAHGRPPSKWFFCFCRECRAEWDGGDADSSEKHKGLCRSVLTFFTFFTSCSSVHPHLGKSFICSVPLAPKTVPHLALSSGSLLNDLLPLCLCAGEGSTHPCLLHA